MSTLRAVPEPSRLNDRIAREVRAELARRGLTQLDLANAIGLSQASVSERLRGKTPFTSDDIERVADALGVHPSVLVGGNAPQPTPPPTDRKIRNSGTDRNSFGTSIVGSVTQLAGRAAA